MNAPRLSARMKALEEAAQIAEERARVRMCLATRDTNFSAAADLSAASEAEAIARLIRERMQNRRAR